MKNNAIKRPLCALFMLLLASCSKKDSTVKFTGVKITQVTISSVSYFKPGGDTWDHDLNPADVYPDLYLTVNNAAGSVMQRSQTKWGSQPADLPLIWQPASPITMSTLTLKYSINLWDDDSDRGRADELMGGYYFTPNDYSVNYPQKITLQNSSSSLILEITVEWF